MKEWIARYIPHHLVDAYYSQGWEITPLSGPHARYSHLATMEAWW